MDSKVLEFNKGLREYSSAWNTRDTLSIFEFISDDVLHILLNRSLIQP